LFVIVDLFSIIYYRFIYYNVMQIYVV